MRSVFLCSPTNSQMFTTCCRVAICEDQAHCPRCKEEVYPGKDTTNHQRSTLRWIRAFGEQRRTGPTKGTP